MARISLTFTEEHIALIKNLSPQRLKIYHDKRDINKYISRLEEILVRKDEDSAENEEMQEIIRDLRSISDVSLQLTLQDADRYYGFDTYEMLTYQEMSDILGFSDKIVENKWSGPVFEDNTKEHLDKLFDFIFDNLVSIEEIIHQRCDKGGIQPNVKYIAYDNEHIWYTEDEFKEMRKKKRAR